MLIQLNHSEDDRVLSACDNLVKIHRDFGGFCDTVIRTRLQEQRRKAREARKRKE